MGIEMSLGTTPAVNQVQCPATYFNEEILSVFFRQLFPEPSESQNKEILLVFHTFWDSTESPVFLRMAFLSIMTLFDALSASLLSPPAFYSSMRARLIV